MKTSSFFKSGFFFWVVLPVWAFASPNQEPLSLESSPLEFEGDFFHFQGDIEYRQELPFPTYWFMNPDQWKSPLLSPLLLDETIWIDGDTIRYLLHAYRENPQGGEIRELLERVQGIRFVRNEELLSIFIFFDDSFTTFVRRKSETGFFQIYAILVPKASQFNVKVKNEILSVSQLPQAGDTWKLKLRVPLFSDTIYLRNGSMDLTNGQLRFEGGALKNRLTLILRGQLTSTRFTLSGLDLGETIRQNLLSFWRYLFGVNLSF